MQKTAVEANQAVLSDAQDIVGQGCKQDRHGKAKQFSWWIITEYVLAGIAWNG